MLAGQGECEGKAEKEDMKETSTEELLGSLHLRHHPNFTGVSLSGRHTATRPGKNSSSVGVKEWVT